VQLVSLSKHATHNDFALRKLTEHLPAVALDEIKVNLTLFIEFTNDNDDRVFSRVGTDKADRVELPNAGIALIASSRPSGMSAASPVAKAIAGATPRSWV
jgi:hypothetical protein